MDWQDLLDNIVPIAFVAIWLVSALVRLVARGSKPAADRPERRSGRRRRLLLLAVVLMLAAGIAFEVSDSVGETEARSLRVLAVLLGVGAVLTILLVGLIRTRSAMQDETAPEQVDRRAEEIRAGKPVVPR